MPADRISRRLPLGVATLLLCCGCGGGLPVAPVAGVVTLDGEPLADATVTTQPIGSKDNPNPGSGSFGTTDASGRYALELVKPERAGAIIGQHRVTISRGDALEDDPWSDDPVVRRDRGWPKRYTDGSLRLEVPEGGLEAANFELTSK